MIKTTKHFELHNRVLRMENEIMGVMRKTIPKTSSLICKQLKIQFTNIVASALLDLAVSGKVKIDIGNDGCTVYTKI